MILITGAAGKTGQAIIQRLAAHTKPIRAWVRREAQKATLQNLGATEVIVGDLLDANLFDQAMQQVTAVYHICPNMHPDEITIGQHAINAALANRVQQFVYHSVLHPQTEKMPHHWHKLRVEEMLFESKLSFTILQPAAYMQNIFGSWSSIINEGIYHVPYPIDTRLSVVDLADVAVTAVAVLTQPNHTHATYELVGPQSLSPQEMASLIGQHLGKSVQAEQLPLPQWQAQARAAGLNPYAVTTLSQMFDYYGRYHFQGNANCLRWLLGHEPTDFQTFLQRESQPM